MQRLSIRRQYAGLIAWVKLANLLTPELEALSQPGQDVRTLSAADYEVEKRRALDRVKQLDRAYRPFAKALKPIVEEIAGWQAFEAARGARDALKALAKGAAAGDLPAGFAPAWRVDADGRIRAIRDLTDQFLDSLQGREVRWIRLCEVCGRLFIAIRVDQLGCSKTCRDTARQRRWRNSMAKYKSNRARNRRARQYQQRKVRDHG